MKLNLYINCICNCISFKSFYSPSHLIRVKNILGTMAPII